MALRYSHGRSGDTVTASRVPSSRSSRIIATTYSRVEPPTTNSTAMGTVRCSDVGEDSHTKAPTIIAAKAIEMTYRRLRACKAMSVRVAASRRFMRRASVP